MAPPTNPKPSSPPTIIPSDILIIGSGIFGTSTAYHLSLTHPTASQITVLDRTPHPVPHGASSDINKIIRADYTSPFYMSLAHEAMDAWSTWPLLRPYFHRTGWVALDESTSDLSTRIRANFAASGRGDPTSDISLDDVKSRWGGVLSDIDTTGFDKAYTNPTAGYCDASPALAAMLAAAVANGITYAVGDVTSLIGGETSLYGALTSDNKIYTARQIVLATGAWTPWLLASLEASLEIPASDSIERQMVTAGVCVAAFTLRDTAEREKYAQMPVLIYGAKGEVMPPNLDREGAGGMFKFTNANTFLHTVMHACGKRVSVPPLDAAQDRVPAALKEESIAIIRERVPGVLEGGRRRPDYWRLCWDAVSPDQNQLICRHPDARLGNLYLATAGSFHSWKFLPTIGKYVVNVLSGVSNGEEKDEAWKWKTEWNSRGAHEKVLPRGELSRFDPDMFQVDSS